MKRTVANYGGISSAAVRKATTKTWAQWLALLDQAGAKKLPHKGIALLLQQKHRLGDWWCQMVAVGYEQARGQASAFGKTGGHDRGGNPGPANGR